VNFLSGYLQVRVLFQPLFLRCRIKTSPRISNLFGISFPDVRLFNRCISYLNGLTSTSLLPWLSIFLYNQSIEDRHRVAICHYMGRGLLRASTTEISHTRLWSNEDTQNIPLKARLLLVISSFQALYSGNLDYLASRWYSMVCLHAQLFGPFKVRGRTHTAIQPRPVCGVK
jgi:hypothetical protein